MFHIILHVLVPGIYARLVYPDSWWRGWLVMLSTMLIDLDHLLANPVYDANRCSINFHPLHTYPAIAVYVLLVFLPKTRLVGIGLVIHMLLDGVDCLFM